MFAFFFAVIRLVLSIKILIVLAIVYFLFGGQIKESFFKNVSTEQQTTEQQEEVVETDEGGSGTIIPVSEGDISNWTTKLNNLSNNIKQKIIMIFNDFGGEEKKE